MQRALRLILACASVLAVVLVAGGTVALERADAKGNPTRIMDGPGIQRPLVIPYPDGWLESTERFSGRIEPLTAAPVRPGEPVLVWSEAWTRLPGRDLDALPPGVSAFDGRYYPDLGVVAVEVADGTGWYRVDAERRDVLDRYVRLARTGALPERPTLVSAALAAWQHLDEPMPFELRIEHETLSEEASVAFWTELSVAGVREVWPSEFEVGATHFSPWTGGVWPVDTGPSSSSDILVQFCPREGGCDGWRLIADRGLLVDARTGWPSWHSFILHPAAQRLIEDRADAVREARTLASPPPTVAATDGVPPARVRDDRSPTTGFIITAASLAGVAGVVGVVRRRGRIC